MGKYLKTFTQAAISTFVLTFAFLSLSSHVVTVYACHNGSDHGTQTCAPSSTPAATPISTPNGNGHTPTLVCHALPAAENEPTNSYESIVIDDDGGDGNVNLQGHQNHAKDVINPGQGVCPIIQGTPLPTDDPEGTSTPTSTPAPTVLGDNDVCANIDGIQTSVPGNLHLDASGRNCVSFELGGPGGSGGGTSGSVLGASTTRGQVLGASTMASAGLAQDIMGIAMVAIGSGMTLTSVYASTKKNYFK